MIRPTLRPEVFVRIVAPDLLRSYYAGSVFWAKPVKCTRERAVAKDVDLMEQILGNLALH
jgi:hypothetical protein